MLNVDGYVFIPNFGRVHPIFGPEKNEKGRENINLMGKIAAYGSGEQAIEEARRYLKEWRGSGLDGIELGKLMLDIAETREEVHRFEKVSPLIVIALCEKNPLLRYFLGQYDGVNSFCNGVASELTKNGFNPFKNMGRLSAFQIAEGVVAQVARQFQTEDCPKIARFNLKLMGKIVRNK